MHVTLRDTDDRLMTHGLSERIAKIKREAYLGRGISLTTDDALAELDRIDGGKPTPRVIKPLPPEPVVERFPFRADIALAEGKLYDLGYEEDVVDAIIADIRRCGSAWCSENFHESAELEHAEIIEKILGDHPDWNRSEWDAVVSLGENAEPIAVSV